MTSQSKVILRTFDRTPNLLAITYPFTVLPMYFYYCYILELLLYALNLGENRGGIAIKKFKVLD